MAWSTISNFSSGESNIVAKLNQYRDNAKSLRLFNDHGVILSLADDMSVNDSSLTNISWDVEQYQVGSIWTIGDPTKLYAPVTGKYTVMLNVEWRSSGSGVRSTGLTWSSGPLNIDLVYQAAVSGGVNMSGMEHMLMTAGQSLTMYCFQTSGGTIGIRGNGPDRTTVAMWLMGI
jgi:hypothetical protein